MMTYMSSGDRVEHQRSHDFCMVRYASRRGKESGRRGRGIAFNHTNATRSHICSNHDWALASFELIENPITFVLLLVTVNSLK